MAPQGFIEVSYADYVAALKEYRRTTQLIRKTDGGMGDHIHIKDTDELVAISHHGSFFDLHYIKNYEAKDLLQNSQEDRNPQERDPSKA
jgi:hypothetical protein